MKKIRSLREKIWEEELFPGCNQKEMKTILAFFAQNKKGKRYFLSFLLPTTTEDKKMLRDCSPAERLRDFHLLVLVS